MARCTGCGTTSAPGERACRECGALLPLSCVVCGTEMTPGQRFCSACGVAVGLSQPGSMPPAGHAGMANPATTAPPGTPPPSTVPGAAGPPVTAASFAPPGALAPSATSPPFTVPRGLTAPVVAPFAGAEGSLARPGAAGATPTPAAPNPAARAEASGGEAQDSARRRVSVLFCDVAGYSGTFAEHLDGDQVRDAIKAYYEVVRVVVTRYGGVVEKFIGEAAVAVWGALVAEEHDAERAVRAALELASAVPAESLKAGVQLQVRVGVASGSAAVLAGAGDPIALGHGRPPGRAGDSGHGGDALAMGNVVARASRLQAAAPTGGCCVDPATRRLVEPAVAFSDAGELTRSGGTPVPIALATGVLTALGGRRRDSAFEAPLTGREAELRALEDVFHECAQRRSPRLVFVSGPPGAGKSRLVWELEKHLDGLIETVVWHSGRCLGYGDGVPMWALAEIVRQCLAIAADEPQDSAAAKLAKGLERYLPATEHRSVGACLARLLGIEQPGVEKELARDDLFVGWRQFFQRLTRVAPLVLVIEDAEDADDGLLDFLEDLVDWSGAVPIVVLVLGGAELAERHPGLRTGRNRTSLALGPLDPPSMGRLLERLVPGLPRAARDSIAERSGGSPLYAVEAVRSLLDQGTLVPGAAGYRVAGQHAQHNLPSVPDGLAALVAARIDALEPESGRLAGVAAVLGTSFTEAALIAVAERPEAEVRKALSDLVRRDVLAVLPSPATSAGGQDEPASYRFSHGLVRQAAYGTVTRRRRRTRHLAVATHLRESFPGEGAEVAGLVARHLLDAIAASPSASDAVELREQAVTALVRAAELATRTGAQASAAQLWVAAADELVTARPQLRPTSSDGAALTRAGLLERAAAAEADARRYEEALRCADLGRRAALGEGDIRLAARCRTAAARALANMGRFGEARLQMLKALTVLRREPDGATVTALAELAYLEIYGGSQGDRVSEEALQLGRRLGVDDRQLSQLFTLRSLAHITANRVTQAVECAEEAVRIAARAEATRETAVGLNTLSMALAGLDSVRSAAAARRASEISRRLGARSNLLATVVRLASALIEHGEWDQAEAVLRGADEEDGLGEEELLACCTAWLAALRGDGARAGFLVDGLSRLRASGNVHDVALVTMVEAHAAATLGRRAEALAAARRVLDQAPAVGVGQDAIRWCWPLAARLARQLDDHAALAELGALLDGYFDEQLPAAVIAGRLLARAWAADDDARAEVAAVTATRAGLAPRGMRPRPAAAYETAVAALRAARSPYRLAWGLLDYGAYLHAAGRHDEAGKALDEARAIATSLRCAPLLQSVAAMAAGRTPAAAAALSAVPRSASASVQPDPLLGAWPLC